MSNIPSIREKCTGALLASAIGDSLGWPYEFRARNVQNNLSMGDGHFIDWNRKSGGRYWSHSETILAGEYSDDTQMILAVSRSIISGCGWKEYFSFKELPYWLKYERGGGNAIKRAAKNYRDHHFPWMSSSAKDYYNAGGNGAAMRILPHVIAHANSQDVEQLLDDVFANSIITHGHPRAILGATCYAFALHTILQKKDILQYGELINIIIENSPVWGRYREYVAPTEWETSKDLHIDYNYMEVWYECVQNMVDQLAFINNSIKKGLLVNDKTVLTGLKCFDKENGAGDVAVLTSLYLTSKYANNPLLGIKVAAYTVGIDTDTIACITGGLLGMLRGTTWIPVEWRMLQDYNCFLNVAEILLSDDMQAVSKRISDVDNNRQELYSSPIGKFYTEKTYEIPSGASGKIIITKVHTLLGQTMYFKDYVRMSKVADSNASRLSNDSNKIIPSMPKIHLSPETINFIMTDRRLSRITFKKVVQIIQALASNNFDCEYVSIVLKVEFDIVKLISDMLC